MSKTAVKGPRWNMKGVTVIGCNCDWGCPCNFSARPTMGFCAGVWGWKIEKGRYEDIELSGLNIAQAAKWPGAIHEGGGTAINFIDKRANREQRLVLNIVLTGQAGEGGPFSIFAPTFTKVHPPRFEAIRISGEKRNPRVEVGEIARSVLEPIRNPVTNQEECAQVVHPMGGFIWDKADVLNAVECRISDPLMCFTFPGKNGHVAAFNYKSA